MSDVTQPVDRSPAGATSPSTYRLEDQFGAREGRVTMSGVHALLRAKRPLSDPFAVALVLAPAPTAATRARLTARPGSSAEAAAAFPEPRLEALRTTMPAARCLPLLRLLARREAGEVVLDSTDGQRLAVEVGECR